MDDTVVCGKSTTTRDIVDAKMNAVWNVYFLSLTPFLLISSKRPPPNNTFAPTKRILVNVSGKSKQNINSNMNKNMTTVEAMNLPF